MEHIPVWLAHLMTASATFTAVKMGFFNKLGEEILEKIPFIKKKKKVTRYTNVIHIARLTQKVFDLQINYKLLKKDSRLQGRELVKCQAKHTECQSDLANFRREMMIKFQQLEKKRA